MITCRGERENLNRKLEQFTGVSRRSIGTIPLQTSHKHFMTLSMIGKHADQDRLENRLQEAWEDYEIDRDVVRDVADLLEPPDYERPEAILDELDQRAERQEAHVRAVL